MVLETSHNPLTEGFYPYEMGYLTPSMEMLAEKELKEKEEKKKKALEELLELIKCEKGLRCRTDEIFLLSFLRARKYNVKKAFKTIQNYYRFRVDHRHIYDCIDNSAVHEVFRQNFLGYLPYRDNEERVIFVLKIGLWDPDTVPRDLLLWTISHCMLHSIQDVATQVTGYSIIIDLQGLNHKHLLLCTPNNITLVLHSTQSCFPGRYKGLHFINVPKLFSIGWAVIYPFIPAKLKGRVFVHGDDLGSLHEKISPSVLPAEYGGLLSPFDNTEFHAKILAKNDWILGQRFYGYHN